MKKILKIHAAEKWMRALMINPGYFFTWPEV
jgi:hypothetical protein